MKSPRPSALKRRTLAAVSLALVFAVLAVIESLRLHDAHRFNIALAEGDYATAARQAGHHGMLAGAFALQLAGETEAAIAAYEELERGAAPSLRTIAKYNLGNMFMRQAAEAGETPGMLSVPLVELAKENYRGVLRVDSADWDARFNLARALQVLPDPESPEASDRLPRSPRAEQTLPAYERLP